MRFTFSIDADNNIGRAEKAAEKRARREDAKALRMTRSQARRTKEAARYGMFA